MKGGYHMEVQKQSLWTKEFISISIINLLLFCGFQMLLPTLPIYAKSLGGANSVIGWIAGVATVASLLIRPFSGLVLDKLGRKVVLIVGICLIIIVTLVYGGIPFIGTLLTIRFLHGLGWGAASTASNTIASDVIPKRRFGEGMGFFSLSSSLAMAIAPGVGLAILAKYSFKHLFFWSSGLTVAALLLSLFIRDNKEDKKDIILTKTAPYEKSSIGASVIMFFVCASYGAITGFLSLYAAERGIVNIGMFFTVYAAFLVFFRPLFGKLIDRFSFDVVIYPGLILLIAAVFILSSASILTSFLISAALYGIGFSAVQSSLQIMAVIHAPEGRIGAANATFFTGFDGGIGFGSVIAGIIASAFGYSKMYLYFSVFIVIAGILYFAISKKGLKEKHLNDSLK